MKQFNWELLFGSNEVAVHCSTKEQARDFCEKLCKRLSTMIFGQNYEDLAGYFNSNGDESCYFSRDASKLCDSTTILEWSEYMTKE